MSFWCKYGKRVFDLGLALSILVVLFPVFLIVSVLVRVDLGSPIVFVQRRLGRYAAEFDIYKFRTMKDEYDADGTILPDEHRTTALGRFLRKSSIDELPQIINIIKGEMSFIGPRATLVRYKDELLEKYPLRFTVLPGITSLPGVSGRNSLTWDEKFSLDCEYVKNFGFPMDAKIFFKTIPVVLGMRNTVVQYEFMLREGGDTSKTNDKGEKCS